MAREAQDREDLLRDATAFATRLQLRVRISERSVVVFAGFRPGGAVSLYFDQDPVYHFNHKSQIRRAFVDDTLIKAENGLLISLTRQQGDREVTMIRHPMTTKQQQDFCRVFWGKLTGLRQAITAEDFVIEGDVNADENKKAIDCMSDFLKQLDKIKVADSPSVAD